MDPEINLPDLVEDLEVNIDELTATLGPLLSLPQTSKSLTVLEKSKLHTLTAYAIESILFSTLLAAGLDAKAHPIFTELARLKGYFAKIKDAEDHMSGRAQREKDGRAKLDVDAAARFIKHGLAGNERYDELRKERVEREKERALEKARLLTNKKFDEEEEGGRKRGVEDAEEEATPVKKVRVDEEEEVQKEEEGTPQPKKKRGRPSKKDRAVAEAATAQNDTPTRATRSSAPKTRTEAFQELAGSPASTSKTKKSKGRGKAK